MPITLLDIVLILVMLVSGLLAMVRGFMREVLSITAWILVVSPAARAPHACGCSDVPSGGWRRAPF